MKEPREFCPTCLSSRGGWRDMSRLRSRGLDPFAHQGIMYGLRPRKHGIVRVPQDTRVRGYGRAWKNSGKNTENRGSIRAKVSVIPGFRRMVARCDDPWHKEMRIWRGLDKDPNILEPRPRTERPPKPEIAERHKAKARRHKARQAKR